MRAVEGAAGRGVARAALPQDFAVDAVGPGVEPGERADSRGLVDLDAQVPQPAE